MTLRIQYASKLGNTLLKPTAPYLVLAGDIGLSLSTPLYLSRSWKDVFVVAGKHDHPGLLISVANKYSNIHYLNRSYVDRDGVRFLGATGLRRGLLEIDRLWLDDQITGCEEIGMPTVIVTYEPSLSILRSPVRAWIIGSAYRGFNGHRVLHDQSVAHIVSNPCLPLGNGFCGDIVMDISTEPGRGGDTRDPLLVASATLPPLA
jgi:hypothetical protein